MNRRELETWNQTTRSQQQQQAGVSFVSSPPRTKIHDLFPIYGKNSSSFYERNIVSGVESLRSDEESQHPPPLRIVSFSSKKIAEKQASPLLEDDLLLSSPLPYYDPYDHDDDDKEEQHREEYCNEKKRPRSTESEYSSFLKCLDTAGDVTAEPTYDTTPDTTTSNDIANAKDSERHTNREFLSATLNFPYKEFISKDGKDHIKIWNDDEEQVRLERHFNPKWQVDFLSTFYGPEGSIRHETVVTPTNTNTIESSHPSSIPQEYSNKRFKCQYDEQEYITSTTKSFSRGGKNSREGIFVDLVNVITDSIGNNKPADKDDDVDLQKAALNLCDAMDMTDLSRDHIARFERTIKFNRQDFLKMTFNLGLE